MANERNHFYYTTCESLSTNKPWDCRQHIMQKTKHNCPCHCADSHFSHLLINRPFNKHQQQEGTSLRADLELHFVQTLHTKVQLTQVNWGIIKHPDVLLWRQCIFSSSCSLHRFISLCFQGIAHPLQNSVRVKLSLQSQHRDVWVYYSDAWRAGKTRIVVFLKSVMSVQFFKSPRSTEDAPFIIIPFFRFPTMCARWLI